MLLTYNQFLTEKYQFFFGELILEGGAAGHMAHPFDYHDLTFQDFKTIVKNSLQGEISFEAGPTEKTDGQNLFVTVKDGKVLFARNKGQLIAPLDYNGIVKMFKGHPSKLVEDTFILSARDLEKALLSLKDHSDFNDGTSFLNMELIYSKNPNVINYDRDVIQFHGMVHTDGSGNITDTSQQTGAKVANIIKEVEANVQKTFTIIPPQILKLQKPVDFEKRQVYYINKLDSLKDEFSLSNNDEVKMYHENWWRREIEKEFGDLSSDLKEGLLLRWAYKDKKTLNLVAMKKMATPDQMKKIKAFDKIRDKKYKENILPFENLFLELGADVLKNASNFVAANPELEKQKLHNKIRKAAQNVKLNGDLTQVAKVEAELNRLETIGGIESIVPTEGIVFKYKGKIMKLTGTFAAINQLMGIIKYGR
tara:strand:- start:3825 stop:5090 length:1266 start_codon:yes stop_codon:yes gene_type:complete